MHGHASWEIIDDQKVNKQSHLHNAIVRKINTSLNFHFISPNDQIVLGPIYVAKL